MADFAHAMKPVLEVGPIGSDFIGRTGIADGSEAAFAEVLSSGNRKQFGAYLALITLAPGRRSMTKCR